MTHSHTVLHSDKHPPHLEWREGELLFHIGEPSSCESGLLVIPNQRLTSFSSLVVPFILILHTVHTVVAMVTSQQTVPFHFWRGSGSNPIRGLSHTAQYLYRWLSIHQSMMLCLHFLTIQLKRRISQLCVFDELSQLRVYVCMRMKMFMQGR